MILVRNMRKFFLACLFMVSTPALASTYIAILETVSEKDVIGRSEKMFLTDKFREKAKTALPSYMGYIIMTRENIVAMLPPGKTLEECEGNCLAETGKNISADYVAQARIGRFGTQYTLTMELYETAKGNLVGSFTTRKPDADGLLDEIEKKADELFKQIIVVNPVTQDAEEDGISNIKMGTSSYNLNKDFSVKIESKPTGATFAVDGKKDGKCNTTPCTLPLSVGNHRFSFSKEMFLDFDTTINIRADSQLVQPTLPPNYGSLILQPAFVDKMGASEKIHVEIDGKETQGDTIHLSPGSHKVEITHRCYEKVSFDVKIKREGVVKFNSELQPLMGALNLRIFDNQKEKNVKIYINDVLKGTTPLTEVMPICAKVSTGKMKNIIIPVKIEAGKTTTQVYKWKNGLDPRDGQNYRTVSIGDQIWMAENLNYKTYDSWCYDNRKEACNTYGRLYSWQSAKKACPPGWRLPSKDDYMQMLATVKNSDYSAYNTKAAKGGAAHKLKSQKGWHGKGNGADYWSFTALPAGRWISSNEFFDNARVDAFFWTSTVDMLDYVFAINISDDKEEPLVDSYDPKDGLSVRCIKE